MNKNEGSERDLVDVTRKPKEITAAGPESPSINIILLALNNSSYLFYQ